MLVLLWAIGVKFAPSLSPGLCKLAGGRTVLHNVILPLIGLIGGLLSLYIDPQKDKAKAWMVIFVMLISAGATGFSGTLDDQKSDASAKEAKQQISSLTEISLNQARRLGDVQSDVGTVKSGILVLLKERGLSITEGITAEQIQRSDQAEAARAPLVPQQLAANQALARPPVVQYFPKDFDGDVVQQALKAGGFEFIPGNSKNKLATNAIWVGDSVTLDNIKFVALTLVRAGVQLRSIRRFHDGGGKKANRIEIGADPELASTPVLSVEQIQSLTKLPPRDVNPVATY